MFLLDVGGSYLSGEAKIAHTSSDGAGRGGPDGSSEMVSFKIDDIVTGYIAPTLVLSDTSSLYVKLGYSEADTGVSGDVTTPADLTGETLAIGTRTVLDSGIFIRTEAGMTENNGISANGKGNTIQTLHSIFFCNTY